tara:strand:+ start:11404 stop:11943 length:540 start_codon:yes stop_codon:yes gene_type:complete
MLFDRPVPGQSLTTTPKNMPYERPPEVTDPDEALAIHLAKLSDADTLEDIMYLLEIDIDIQTIVEGITRSAVMAGIHSVDVSLIVQPTMHEFIRTAADALDVEYKTGFEKEDRSQLRKDRASALSNKKLEKMGINIEETLAQVDMEEVKERPEEEAEEAMQDVTQAEKPKGLMAKESVE